MTILSKQEIALLQAGIEAGRINPHDAFKNEAMRDATDRVYGFEWEATIGLILAGVGASINPMVGIGILLAAGGHIWNKLQNGDRIVQEIERGEFEKHLPRESRLAYQEILTAQRKRLGAPKAEQQPQQQPEAQQGPLSPFASQRQGSNTVEVQAAPSPTPEPANPFDAQQPESPSTYNVAQDMGTHPQNTLIIGKPGSGKGMLLANAIRELQRRSPNTRVFVIDPKGDPREQGYWPQNAAVRSEQIFGWEPSLVGRWVNQCIDEFAALPAPKLLIVDEMKHLSSALRSADDGGKSFKLFWQRIEAFTSFGDAQQIHVWGVSQVAHASDLNITGGTRSLFRVVALVRGEDLGYLDSLTATQIIPKPSGGIAFIKQLAQQSPVNRAFYDGKRADWFPMPRLENYSEIDRDTRQAVTHPPSTEGRLEAAYAATPSLPATTPPAPNAFAEAIAKVRDNADCILDLVEVRADAIERLIGWLYDNKRGQVVTIRQVIENKANRDVGLSSKGNAVDAMALLEMLGLCHSTGEAEQYFVIS